MQVTVDGSTYTIGFVAYGTELGIKDYSRKDRDEFGAITIIERGFSRLVKYKIECPQEDVEKVQEVLAYCRAKKAVYTGHPDRPELTVEGVLENFSIPLSDWGPVEISLEVQSEVTTPSSPPAPW